jgi:hypothetical protein
MFNVSITEGLQEYKFLLYSYLGLIIIIVLSQCLEQSISISNQKCKI